MNIMHFDELFYFVYIFGKRNCLQCYAGMLCWQYLLTLSQASCTKCIVYLPTCITQLFLPCIIWEFCLSWDSYDLLYFVYRGIVSSQWTYILSWKYWLRLSWVSCNSSIVTLCTTNWFLHVFLEDFDYLGFQWILLVSIHLTWREYLQSYAGILHG